MNNYYLASQLVADRQAALAADVTRRARVWTARARKASAASAARPARTRRLFSGRPAPAGA